MTRLTQLSENDVAELNYTPVPIAKKFSASETLLKAKIAGYVSLYYPMIREELRQLDGKNGFLLQVLSEQIRSSFLKMNAVTTEKAMIFSQIVLWIKGKTQSSSIEACEAIVAYFVQNCEVFYEITE